MTDAVKTESGRMKAIVFTNYGPPGVLQLQEVDKPVPKEDEVLVRIYATTVTAGDCEIRGFRFRPWIWLMMRLWLGVLRPRGRRVLGTELAGRIVGLGKNVDAARKGERVFGSSGLGFGTNAEYKCLPAHGALEIAPDNLSYEEAASVPFGGRDALHFLRKANLRPGTKILINGAAGSIGTFGVQLAKHFGAEVTAVDGAEKLEMLRSIGADHVIDYAREDFTRTGKSYDVIFDVVGKSSFSGSLRSLAPDGHYLLANPGLPHMLRGAWTSMTTKRTVVSEPASGTTEDLVFLRELIEGGNIRPVMDRSYSLERIVEAHEYLETGAKQGNVAITVATELAASS